MLRPYLTSIGGVRIVSLGCGEVLGTHEPTRFNHNGPYMTFSKKYVYRSCKTGLKCDIQKSGLSKKKRIIWMILFMKFRTGSLDHMRRGSYVDLRKNNNKIMTNPTYISLRNCPGRSSSFRRFGARCDDARHCEQNGVFSKQISSPK